MAAMFLLSLCGPAVVAASIAYVYLANHPTASQLEHNTAFVFPVSTLMYCGALFFVYVSGVMPRNPLFPAFVFRANIFRFMYRIYCSQQVGYRVLRRIMHQPVAYPHSDYRQGTRCLDAGSPLRLKLAPVGARHALPFLQQFYKRGGGVVDYALWSGATTRGVVVVPVALFGDNYAYLIVSMQTHKVAVVDPADAEMVLRVLDSLRRHLKVPLQLTEILATHKHWDHSGGNKELADYAKQMAAAEAAAPAAAPGDVATNPLDGVEGGAATPLVSPQLRIIGSDLDRPHACTEFVNDDSPAFAVAGGGASVRAVAVPGHTRGSLVFVVGTAESGAEAAAPPRVAVFTGDSLFSGGCGAPFETASVTQIIQTRNAFLEDHRMRTQPATGQEVAEEDVLLYVGHEYTERLLQEVTTLMTRVLDSRGTAADPRGNRYLRIVNEAFRAVKVLREESDGLQDASMVGRDGGRAGPAFRLPSCTVPSSLAMEKAINPFLTVDDEELAALAATESGGGMDSRAVERAIYCTDRRTVFPASGQRDR